MSLPRSLPISAAMMEDQNAGEQPAAEQQMEVEEEGVEAGGPMRIEQLTVREPLSQYTSDSINFITITTITTIITITMIITITISNINTIHHHHTPSPLPAPSPILFPTSHILIPLTGTRSESERY
jgi:hypothetical protein